MRGIHTQPDSDWPYPGAEVALPNLDVWAGRGVVLRPSTIANVWIILPTITWHVYTAGREISMHVDRLRPAPGSPEDDLTNGYPPTYNLQAANPELTGRRVVEAMRHFAAQAGQALNPETDTMRLTHYVPLDTVLGRPIRQHLTCCGLLVADLIDAFDGNEGFSDRYIPGGTPRPGQITCGPCAVAVPRWWDPEWDEPVKEGPEPAAAMVFQVSADYRYDAACAAITKIIEYLDPDSIRGGILIIPTSKEQ